jgi:hypothetical protein
MVIQVDLKVKILISRNVVCRVLNATNHLETIDRLCMCVEAHSVGVPTSSVRLVKMGL